MSEYGYLIRTLSNNLHVEFMNYLYGKKDVVVNIDTNVYNIYIRIKYENDFNEILETTRGYYGNNVAVIKPEPSIQPVFINNSIVAPVVQVVPVVPEVVPVVSEVPEVVPEVIPEVVPDVVPVVSEVVPEVVPTSEVTSNIII